MYEHLYEGNEIIFDLNAIALRFVMEKTGEISHKNKFKRKVKATAPKHNLNDSPEGWRVKRLPR